MANAQKLDKPKLAWRSVIALAMILASLAISPNAVAIVGGEKAGPASPGAKSTVLLYVDFEITVHTPGGDGVMTGQSFCTGVLIGDHTILTAAHCVFPSPRNNKRVSKDPPTYSQRPISSDFPKTLAVYFAQNFKKYFIADRILRHPGFAESVTLRSPTLIKIESSDDLALIHIKEKAPAEIPRIKLYRQEISQGTSVPITSMGYGATSVAKADNYNPAGVGVLRQVDKVGAVYKKTLLYNQRDGRGFCRGDSGGPDFVTVDGETYVAGIHSFFDSWSIQVKTAGPNTLLYDHTEADQCKRDARSMLVPAYLDWIQNNLETLESKQTSRR